jgi:hypothetical protein
MIAIAIMLFLLYNIDYISDTEVAEYVILAIAVSLIVGLFILAGYIDNGYIVVYS